MNILVVDDNDLVRQTMVVWLRMSFPCSSVRAAGSVEEAVAVARALPHDLVLLDLDLPNQDSFEAIRAIKEASPGTHIVALSVRDDPGSVETALEAGAAAYVAKSRMHSKVMPTIAGLDQFFPGDSTASQHRRC